MSESPKQPTEKKGGLFGNINMWSFTPAAVILVAMIIWGAVAPDGFANAMNSILGFILKDFSWLYALGIFALVVFCVYVAASKYGNIRIGGDNAKPELSFFSWFAIALTSGIAVGIMYWGVAEPLTFFHNPPSYLGMEGGSVEAAENALRYNFLHWTLTPYAVFTAAGLGVVFMFYNGKRKYKMSSGLYPLIGDKCDGKVGSLIDSLCIFGLIGGLIPSVGLGAMQMLGGFGYVTGRDLSSPVAYFIFIAALAVIFILSACSGIHKGIKYISQANVYIYIFMLVFVFITGGTLFILNNTVTNIGTYLNTFIEQSLYLEPAKQTGWVQGWSIFYWSWWLAPGPIIGLFMIKLAKGRTIREFVIVNLIAPSLFGIVWFGIFGSSAINLEFFQGADIYSDVATYGSNVALFAFFKNLPLKGLLYIAGFAACLFSFVTMAESMVLAIADSSTKTGFDLTNDQASPNSLKVFWGLILAGCGFIMIITGGISALQTASIICGLPSLILLLVLMVAFIKSVSQREKYDLTLQEEPAELEEAGDE
ncbi:MAG: BCCT family transporter [Firmicutes bacterium]|nr:BCCT family transporter [Bacillota bacterium]